MIKVLGDRVLVKPDKKEEQTEGGIYIPDQAREKPLEGTIINIGPDVKFDIKINDKIMHGRYSGTEIEHENEKYLIMKEEDLLLIIGVENE